MTAPDPPPVPLAPGPETARIAALLDGVRSGLAATPGAAARDAGETSDAARRLAVPPGDDAAAFAVPAGAHVVVSSDASVEGIHFRREWMTWEVIGHRAAAAALSDLAAMAASPVGVVLSAALPPELDAGTAAAIGRGVGSALAVCGGEILGGDLVASPGPVMLDVTVLGRTAAPVTRGGARPGDEIWLTGAVGGAAAAVADLQAGLEPLPAGRAAFERPRPRIAEALWLAERAELHALIDLSDGLARDARHVAVASGVGLELELGAIPPHEGLEPYLDSEAGRRLLLAGGEDYELLMAAPPGALEAHAEAFETRFGIPLTRIGRVTSGRGARFLGSGGESVPVPGGFDHFAAGG